MSRIIEFRKSAQKAEKQSVQGKTCAFTGHRPVSYTHLFKPDERKAGGEYVTATGAVKKVDDFERLITMQDGTKIPMDDVLSIDGELFSSLE